jgi:hypothetical protein
MKNSERSRMKGMITDLLKGKNTLSNVAACEISLLYAGGTQRHCSVDKGDELERVHTAKHVRVS